MSNSKENGIPTDQYSEAFRFFGLNTQDGMGAAKKRFKELARNYHPDKGGDVSLMQMLNSQYEIINQYYKENNSTGKTTEQVIFQDTDSFSSLFQQFAEGDPFEVQKKTPPPQHRYNSYHEETPKSSHFSSNDHKNESPDEFHIRMSQEYVQSQLGKMADTTSLSAVMSFIFGVREATGENIAKAQTILQGKKNLDEAKRILLLASHITQSGIRVPAHYSLNVAESLASCSLDYESMVRISKYCEHFLFDKFKLFINPTEKKIDCWRNELFIGLFNKMFRALNEAGSEESTVEKKMFFENAYAKANDFITHSSKTEHIEVLLEIGKIFGLIFHDTVSMDERLDMINSCKAIISSRYYQGKDTTYKKIQSIFNYFLEREFSPEAAKLILQSIEHIQDKKTRIPSLRYPKKMCLFYERLEETVHAANNEADNETLHSQIGGFIASAQFGSRGYSDGHDELAMNEWVEALKIGFRTFRQFPSLFNDSMEVFHEFSLPPRNKAFLSNLESIRIPVLSAVSSAQTLIAFLNTKHGDDLFEKRREIKTLELLMRAFQQNRYFDLQKKQDYTSLPSRERELYEFFNSIQRRDKKRSMFLPDDMNKVIELCFQDGID